MVQEWKGEVKMSEVSAKIKWLEQELKREKRAGNKNAVKTIERDIRALKAVKGR